MYQRLDEIVTALAPEALSTLRAWIQIPSVKEAPLSGAPFGAPVRAMLDRALEDAQALGFQTRNFDGYIGDVEMGAGERVMGILAHLDVVPAGDGWQTPPFGAVVENGKVYGRGTSDDKGPAVAALYAMKAVLQAGLTPKARVRLLLGCDEESGWQDIAYYKQQERMPDFGFSPDASYPVINTEKGIVRLSLDGALPGETGAARPVYCITAGERANVIPGLATAEIGCRDAEALEKELLEHAAKNGWTMHVERLSPQRVRIVSTGVTGHAAMPENTRNAAGQLFLALSHLHVGGGSRALIERVAQTIGLTHDGAGLGVAASDAVSGALTMNLGVVRIDPHHAHLMLDIRYPVLMSAQAIMQTIAHQLEDIGITVSESNGQLPLHVPAQSAIVQTLLRVYTQVTGKPGYPVAIGGGTYARSMPQCVAFGCSFPGDPDLAHQAGECFDVEALTLNIRIFAHAIAALVCA